MIDAILWDNDGVLVDTERLYFQATRNALAKAGVDLTRRLYCEISLLRGGSTFDLIADPAWTEDRKETLRRERNAEYTRLLRTEPLVFPGVLSVLRELSGKLRMAIVTSSPREHFDLIHENAALREFFEFALAREDYASAKPHPDPYLTALERFGLPAARCLAIEDSERGLASARAAGLRCIVVPNELTRECSFEGAAAILPNLADLQEIIRTL